MKAKSIKKGLLVLACALLVACGPKEEETRTSDAPKGTGEETSFEAPKESSAEASEGSKESEPVNDAVKDLLVYTHKVSGREMYVDLPAYHEYDKGYTRLFMNPDELFVAVIAQKSTEVSTLEEAFDKAYDCFRRSVQSKILANELTIISDETVTINGIEMYHFEGSLNCGYDRFFDINVYGYAFIMAEGNHPMMIMGGNAKEGGQSDELDAQMKEITEAVIQTVRTVK